MPTVDHVVNAARCAAYDLASSLQRADVLSQRLPADAGVRADVHVVAERHHHVARLHGQLARRRQHQRLRLLAARIDRLQHAHAEDGRLARTGLGLGDDIATLQNRNDGALLDGGRLLEA